MPTIVTKAIKASGGDYGSLAAWEAGQNGDLVTPNQIQEAVCYGMFDDATFAGVDIAGGTTSATNYLWIHAAPGAEAQMPFDATGVAYRLEAFNAGGGVLVLDQDYTRVERIQIRNYGDDNGCHGILISTASTGVRVVGCTITNVPPVTFGSNGFAIFSATDAAGDRFIVNNFIVWDSRAGAGGVYGIFTNHHVGGNCYIYNNTVICGGVCTGAIGLRDTFSDVIFKNNLVKGFAGGAFEGPNSSNCTNNAADDATVVGTGARASQTFTFAGAGDYHLSSSDAGARTFGADLSADANFPFSTDFDGSTRVAPWDIGADEVGTATPHKVYGIYDPTYQASGWFDPTIRAAGWFDDDLTDHLLLWGSGRSTGQSAALPSASSTVQAAGRSIGHAAGRAGGNALGARAGSSEASSSSRGAGAQVRVSSTTLVAQAESRAAGAIVVASHSTIVAESAARAGSATIKASHSTIVAQSTARGAFTSFVSSVGRVIAQAFSRGSATAISPRSGLSQAQSTARSPGAAIGQGIGRAEAQAIARAGGANVASGTGRVEAQATTRAAGNAVKASHSTVVTHATARAVGAAVANGVGRAIGSATARASALSFAIGKGLVLAQSWVLAATSTTITATGIGISHAQSWARAIGAAISQQTGQTRAPSTARGIVVSTVSSIGRSQGTSTSRGSGAPIATGAGRSVASSWATGAPAIIGVMVGRALGFATALLRQFIPPRFRTPHVMRAVLDAGARLEAELATQSRTAAALAASTRVSADLATSLRAAAAVVGAPRFTFTVTINGVASMPTTGPARVRINASNVCELSELTDLLSPDVPLSSIAVTVRIVERRHGQELTPTTTLPAQPGDTGVYAVTLSKLVAPFLLDELYTAQFSASATDADDNPVDYYEELELIGTAN